MVDELGLGFPWSFGAMEIGIFGVRLCVLGNDGIADLEMAVVGGVGEREATQARMRMGNPEMGWGDANIRV